MKTYEVTAISGQPDWQNIPTAAIDTYLWSDVRSIIPSAQAAWDEDALYVRLQAIEPHILRRFTGTLDEVCKDSCLEFFFCPEETGDRYFNFEANPNGSYMWALADRELTAAACTAAISGSCFRLPPLRFPAAGACSC